MIHRYMCLICANFDYLPLNASAYIMKQSHGVIMFLEPSSNWRMLINHNIFLTNNMLLTVYVQLFILCAGQIVLPLSPRAPPGTSLFFCCPGLLINSFFPSPALYYHENHFFSSAPPFFITHFSSYPGAAREGVWGQNNLTST